MIRSLIIFLLIIIPEVTKAQSQLLKSFDVTLVQQSVAVDKDHFFVINNNSITKHLKSDGTLAGKWDGRDSGVKHLNSGVVIEDKLYCSHSNFPDSPMAGSIEVFNINTMEHVDSHSFGIMIGSTTWIDRYNNNWYVAFAHYAGDGSSEGKNPDWTQLVKLDNQWRRLEAWIFPEEVLERMHPYSTSGGVWTGNGQLIISGHDKQEVYLMELPQKGYTLNLLEIIEVPNPGQGIAWDHWADNVMWGIDRKENKVLKIKID